MNTDRLGPEEGKRRQDRERGKFAADRNPSTAFRLQPFIKASKRKSTERKTIEQGVM